MANRDDLRNCLLPLTLSNDELKAMAAALEKPPRRAIRLRPGLSASNLSFAISSVPWHSRGLILSDDVRPSARIEYAAGDYFIQDASSLLAVTLLDAQPGERICDLCAAPGGKATAILECLAGAGWLLANEAIRSRVGPLKFNLARHGSIRYGISQQDPHRLAEMLGGTFDAVLVDAPCTGQSLLAKRKQSPSALSDRQINHSAARQARILDAAAKLVQPGGRLVYSTCTFSYRENEQQIVEFNNRCPSFRVRCDDRLARWESPALAGTYRLWPHRDKCGGAFAARLFREDDSPVEVRQHNSRWIQKPWQHAGSLPRIADWGQLSNVRLFSSQRECCAWPEPVWDALPIAAKAGPNVAVRRSQTWTPAYALAMRRDENWQPNATVTLGDPLAIRYLAGHMVPQPRRGWFVATWSNRPLGWLKGDGRQAKNHLPKSARLKIEAEDLGADRPAQ